MSKSIVSTFLHLNNFPKYPNRDDLAFSINQDENSDVSLKVDKSIWTLYKEAEKKIGRLGAYNQIHDSISNTEKDLSLSLKAIKKNEKYFKKYLELIAEHGIYAEVTSKIREHLQEAVANYPVINYQKYSERYQIFSSELISCVVLIDKYSRIFRKIPMTGLSLKASELKKAIYHFDYLHVLHIRLIDFLDLIKKDGIHKNLKEGEFVRDSKVINEYNSSKKGPSIDEDIYYDIERILDKCLADDFRTNEKIYHDKKNENESRKPIISTLVDLALGDKKYLNEHGEEKIVDKEFGQKWSSDHQGGAGYDKRTLEKRFSEFYTFYENLKS